MDSLVQDAVYFLASHLLVLFVLVPIGIIFLGYVIFIAASVFKELRKSRESRSPNSCPGRCRQEGRSMRQADLLEMVDRCIALCREEKAAGYPGEATREQVEQYVLPELYELRQKVAGRDIPSDRSQRYLTAFGYAFKCWDWNMREATELYNALAQLHNAYRDCAALL